MFNLFNLTNGSVRFAVTEGCAVCGMASKTIKGNKSMIVEN